MLKINLSRSMSFCFAIALALLVTACGGGGSSSSTSATAPIAAVPKLTLATSAAAITSSSPATLTATVTDASGAPVPNTVVTFTTQGTNYGSFFPTAGTSLSNSAGVATILLNAGTAIGADTVTATASVNGVAATSSLGYSVSAAPVTTTAASINFLSATPTVVAIHNTGGKENSVVVFTVRDGNGNPLANQLVNFALSTNVGNPTVTASDTSKSDGTVTAQLQAGTVTTPVRVKATLASNSNVATVSSQLVISTALPHQNGFSFAATPLNIEAFNYDGVQTTLSVRMSDRYGNLVPDGTAVTFRTAGGVGTVIPSSCTTTNSTCSVQLLSSGARPANGRLVVLATAIGEESFVDTNGNGIYDAGEPFTDLPEAFVDANENGFRDSTEEFVDFNNDGKYTLGNGVFDGVLKADGTSSTVNVRGSVTIVLSTSGAKASGLPNVIALAHCVDNTPFNNPPQSFSFQITDLNNNSMAPGTTVTITTTNGTLVSTPTTFTLLDNNTTTTPTYPISIISDATLTSSGVCSNPSTSGTLQVTVKSPRGVITTFSIPVSD